MRRKNGQSEKSGMVTSADMLTMSTLPSRCIRGLVVCVRAYTHACVNLCVCTYVYKCANTYVSAHAYRHRLGVSAVPLSLSLSLSRSLYSLTLTRIIIQRLPRGSWLREQHGLMYLCCILSRLELVRTLAAKILDQSTAVSVCLCV